MNTNQDDCQKKPLVSVITINYHNLEGLKRTRASVIEQTFASMEWIVIDGGSGDEERTFIEQHQSEMAYWCSEPDGGVYHAMNKGILKVQGEYCIFMNSGDMFYDSHVLENVFKESPSADVLYGDWSQSYPDGNTKMMYAPKVFSMHFICTENICHQAMFIRSEVMKASPYDERYLLYADWAKWIELALQGCRFQYVPWTICHYEMNGMSQKQTEQLQQELKKIQDEAIPPAMKETLSFFTKNRGVATLSREVERLSNKKRRYKRMLQNCVGFIHFLEKVGL